MKKIVPFFGLFLLIIVLKSCNPDQELENTNNKNIPANNNPATSKKDTIKEFIKKPLNSLLKDTGDQMHTGGKDKTESNY